MTDEPIIRVSGLSFAYPGGHAALKDVSFTVAAGETVGIIGPNGAGKTTLMRMLATLTRPDAGHASVMGHDLVAARFE